MKKFLSSSLLLVLLTVGFLHTNAQSFQEGAVSVQAGYGIGNFMQAIFETYDGRDNYSFSATGPFFAKIEYGASETIGFGLNIAYAGANAVWDEPDPNTTGRTVGTEVDWSSISLLLRVNYHFGSSEKFDPYFGAGLGYRTATWDTFYEDDNFVADIDLENPFQLGLEATIGARYLFTDNIGFYVEAGLAKAIMQGGINIKIQ